MDIRRVLVSRLNFYHTSTPSSCSGGMAAWKVKGILNQKATLTNMN